MHVMPLNLPPEQRSLYSIQFESIQNKWYTDVSIQYTSKYRENSRLLMVADGGYKMIEDNLEKFLERKPLSKEYK